MYKNFSKKIIKVLDNITFYVRQNIAQIVIIVGVFVTLEVIQSFPYINIIPNYQFLVIGFTLLLGVVLLRFSVSNKKIILLVLALFCIAIITTIFDIKRISDLIGFIIFVLLTIATFRQIFQDRRKLKELDSP